MYKQVKFLKAIVVFLTLQAMQCSVSAQVTIGSDISSPNAAIVNIQTQVDSNPAQGGITSQKGGLLLSRVRLVNVESLEPFISGGGTNVQKAAHKGMNVYHIGGNGIDAGQYVWDGVRWLHLLTDIPAAPISTVHTLDLMMDVMSVHARYDATENGILLPFGDFNVKRNRYEIAVEEDGSYAFSFRLYGAMLVPVNLVSYPLSYGVFYINVMRYNPTKNIDEVVDVAEINISMNPANGLLHYGSSTYSVTMGCTASRGDVITFRWCHLLDPSYNPAYTEPISFKLQSLPGQINAARTSLIYWKL
ncbi:hypothetical protein D0T56_08890 [Dysgonomonas sp. 520]|nr:hypothetical protein [Dysgonomonas sp. 520]